ncbi:MAG TPA: type II toxin-antitoxin system HicB family antitoxin [Caulobacteraceae bacterium]|jgi:antitoxin HicB|nr:type II toxin-antitoxin system HicB family antitoxin [Caulobacteraceae bacterium]
MHPLTYPAKVVEAQPNDFVVQFIDIPEAISGGATVDEALAEAAEALEVAVEYYLNEGRAIPDPSPVRGGQHDVALAPAIAARLLLIRTMTEQKLSKVALAARMGRDEKVVRRVLSGKGASLDLTLAALKAIGVRPALAV